MLISYKWLSELVEPGLGPKELAEKLTLIGLEIDAIHENGEDVVFDIEVTSNRGDCLSHYGVAREVSAFSGNPVKLPGNLVERPVATDRVEIRDPELCLRFTSRVIKNVKVGPSPDWLVEKLEAVGERSINNIADITNFVMHELGQPMHAFDLDKLAESKIVVRRANDGETIKTLDEVERKLNSSILAICDTEKPVAVAGVMGGYKSGITDESTNVLLEVANFESSSIRESSKTLSLSTEASYRFERGVDIENVVRASNRASELICELAGGSLEDFCDIYPAPAVQETIAAPELSTELNRLTGIQLPLEQIEGLLAGLGIEKEDEGSYRIPTWRHDLSIPEDLVEEAIRVYGYDQIEEALPQATGAGEYFHSETRKKRLRNTMSAIGFDEAISYSFVDSERSQKFISPAAAGTALVRIKDPIIDGADLMRPTLMTGLIDSIRTNLNHKAADLRIFELGKVFSATTEDKSVLPLETEMLGIVITGRERVEGSAAAGREYDYFDLKAAVEQAADALGVPGLIFAEAEFPFYQAGQSAAISLNGTLVGNAGKLNANVAAEYKFKQPVFAAEINVSELLKQSDAVSVYTPLPLYPSIKRDVSLLVSDGTGFGDISGFIEALGLDLFENVLFVDTYSGSGIADDERSMTIRLEYRSYERTLTDEEVDAVHSGVLKELTDKFNARFR